ncbi:hypothetical protein [Kitasatospora sp. McL0602]|uniref:hypothetical protein n=1 Tax=Kitasatospora sp. McL0602 TaxID=3439530 RepID=UPI003F8B4095
MATVVCQICSGTGRVGTGRVGGLQCTLCSGTGTRSIDAGGNCMLCDGTGVYKRYRIDAVGNQTLLREEICRTCDGTGSYPREAGSPTTTFTGA